MEDNYLAHHGVKGMKWGVRRTPEQLGHKAKTSDKESKSKTESFLGKTYSSKVRVSREKRKIREKVKAAAKKQKESQQLTNYQKKMEKRYGLTTKTNPKSKTERAVSKPNEMSTEELKKVVDRIALEKRYAELTAPTPKAESFLTKSAKRLADTAVQTVGTKLINNAINSALAPSPNQLQNQNGNKKDGQEVVKKPQLPPTPASENKQGSSLYSSFMTSPTLFTGKVDYNYEPSSDTKSFIEKQKKQQ